MKVSRMPLSNKLQAIETILDSQSQSRVCDRGALRLALRIVRSAQPELFGPRFVKERSIRRLWANYRTPSMLNYRKWRRERALKQDMRLPV